MPAHEVPRFRHTQNVWRYMSFSRFVWLLQRKALWLSRIDQLGDPWELSLSGSQLAHVIATAPIIPITSREPTEPPFERSKRIIELWRKNAFVNCWSAQDHESHALWRVYCPTREGVAIQTTLGDLEASVPGLPVSPIRYCEVGSVRRTPDQMQLITEKRQMFAYEHEVRVIYLPKKGEYDDAESEVLGVPLEWNVEAALDSVWVHPEADGAFMQTVQGVVEHYAPSLSQSVFWSQMRTAPPF